MKTKKLLKSVTLLLTLSIVMSQLTFVQTANAATSAREEVKNTIIGNKILVNCFESKLSKQSKAVKKAEDAYSKCRITALSKDKTNNEICYKKEIKEQDECIAKWERACSHIFEPEDKLNKCYADFYNKKDGFLDCLDKTETTYNQCLNNATTSKDEIKKCDTTVKTFYNSLITECQAESLGTTAGQQARLDANPKLKKCFDKKVSEKADEYSTFNKTFAKCQVDSLTTWTEQSTTCEKEQTEKDAICLKQEIDEKKTCNKTYAKDKDKLKTCLKTVGDRLLICAKASEAIKNRCVTLNSQDALLELTNKCKDSNAEQKQGLSQVIENECLKELGITTTTPTDTKPDIDTLLYKFTSSDTANPTTTDYVASLPEDATPGNIFSQIVYYMLVVANIAAFLSLIVAGAMMIISQGNDELLGKSKRIFTYAIIAMLVCALSLAVVTGITKLNFFNP